MTSPKSQGIIRKGGDEKENSPKNWWLVVFPTPKCNLEWSR